MTPAIAVDGLTFRYRGRKEPCLRDLSFVVPAGETVLVLGPSGGGKSTLAFCLNGMIPHGIDGELSGTVHIHGRDTRARPLAATAREVGIVFQDPETQFCTLRVDDEIAFGLENLGVPRAQMPERIAAAMEAAGLGCKPDTRIDHLSGGNKQRLALACVLAMQPSVLVFDEPTSNLDPAGAVEVFAALRRLKIRGEHTMIVVEHRLDGLMDLIDRVIVLGPDGSLIDDGAPRRVLSDQAVRLEREGIWIPQVCELAAQLKVRGIELARYPLTVDEAMVELGTSPPAPPLGRAGRLSGEVGRVSWQHHPGLPSRAAIAPIEPPLPSQGRGGGRGSLTFNHLSYRYGKGPWVLRDVSLTVQAGDFCAIVGPNGAGKSTLAQHLIATLRPPRGTVFLGDRDVRDLSATELASTVGYVFQNPEHQFVARTVFDELAFGLRLRRVPEPDIRAKVEALLAEFGLARLALANPFQLSHGEKRRLSVATMLILEQHVLVLDEPTFGQDRRNAEMLLSICEQLHRNGRTILMITHDMRLVAEHARTVVVLVDGKVVYRGEPQGLFADAALMRRAQLAPPPMVELRRRLLDNKWMDADGLLSGALPATVESLATMLAGTLAPERVAV